jgi:hypothetical protein
MRPNKEQIEVGIKSTGKYRQEDGYSLQENICYTDGWYDAIEFIFSQKQSSVEDKTEKANSIENSNKGLQSKIIIDNKPSDQVSDEEKNEIIYAGLYSTAWDKEQPLMDEKPTDEEIEKWAVSMANLKTPKSMRFTDEWHQYKNSLVVGAKALRDGLIR